MKTHLPLKEAHENNIRLLRALRKGSKGRSPLHANVETPHNATALAIGSHLLVQPDKGLRDGGAHFRVEREPFPGPVRRRPQPPHLPHDIAPLVLLPLPHLNEHAYIQPTIFILLSTTAVPVVSYSGVSGIIHHFVRSYMRIHIRCRVLM